VPSFVPANALLLRDRGLEPIEQLFGSRSRLAALEIDDAHRQSLSLADPHGVRGRESVTASPLGSEMSPELGRELRDRFVPGRGHGLSMPTADAAIRAAAGAQPSQHTRCVRPKEAQRAWLERFRDRIEAVP